MTTGTTVVTSALRRIGVIGKSIAAASGDNLTIGLEALNDYIQSRSNVKTLINAVTTVSFPFVAAQAPYTTAVFAGGRPISIDYMYITLSGVSYPCELIVNQSFDDIGYKSASGIPTVCYYDNAFPTGTMTFFPVPYSTALSCVCDLQYPLTGAISAGTTIALAPGYDKWIKDSLAVYVATYFPGAPVSPLLAAEAREAERVLRAINYTPLVSDIGWNRPWGPPTQWLPPF